MDVSGMGAGAVMLSGMIIHLGFGVGLTLWSARIASQRGGAYRTAVALAPLGLIVGLLGACLTVRGLILAFGAVAHADASERSSLLASGISEAMNATAIGIGGALLLYLASAVTSAVGARRSDRARAEGGAGPG